jgi:hypothetical protein
VPGSVTMISPPCTSTCRSIMRWILAKKGVRYTNYACSASPGAQNVMSENAKFAETSRAAGSWPAALWCLVQDHIFPGWHLLAVASHFSTAPDASICWGFMHAIEELSTMVKPDGKRLLNICTPPNGSLTQMIRVVVNYGEQHPEELHEGPGIFALIALQKAFPCQ